MERGESFYQKRMERLVEELKSNGLYKSCLFLEFNIFIYKFHVCGLQYLLIDNM